MVRAETRSTFATSFSGACEQSHLCNLAVAAIRVQQALSSQAGTQVDFRTETGRARTVFERTYRGY
jgi:hypothetical protein